MSLQEDQQKQIERLRAMGRDLEARRLLTDYVTSHPTDPWGYVTLGRTNLERRDYAQAKSLFDRARSIAPHSFPVLMALADLAFARNRHGEGMELLDQAAQAEDADWELVDEKRRDIQLEEVQRSLTRAQQKGDSNGILQAYRQWVQLDPENIVAHAGLGKALHALGEEDEALEHLETAVHGGGGAAGVWERLGLIYQHRGQIRLAADAYQMAVDRGLARDAEDQARARLQELAGEWAEHVERLVDVLRDNQREYWDDPDQEVARALTAVLPLEPQNWRRTGSQVGNWVNTRPGRVWPKSPSEDGEPTPARPRIEVTTDRGRWVIARLDDYSVALFEDKERVDAPHGIQKTIMQAVAFAHRSGHWQRCLHWADAADLIATRPRVKAFRADSRAELGDAEQAATLYKELKPTQVEPGTAVRATRVFLALDDEQTALHWLRAMLEGYPERRGALEDDPLLVPLLEKIPEY